jgi:hypothetical protein
MPINSEQREKYTTKLLSSERVRENVSSVGNRVRQGQVPNRQELGAVCTHCTLPKHFFLSAPQPPSIFLCLSAQPQRPLNSSHPSMTSTQPQQSILTEEQKDNIKTLWRHLQSLKLYVSHNDQQIPLFVPHNEQHAAYFKYALNANSLGMYISIEKNPDFVVATDLLKYDSFGRTILHIAAISGDIEIR